MHALAIVLAAMPIAAFASGHGNLNRMNEHKARHVRRDNGYTLRTKHQGKSFFDDWYFFTGGDPTGGYVDYVDQKTANSAGLAYVQDDGTAVMLVDNKSKVGSGGKRKSVRLTSKESYNDGLFIADFYAMPYGPGVWPAYWSVGPNWPSAGELDIVEYVNNNTYNQYTLHTGENSVCTLNKDVQGAYKNSAGELVSFLGNVMGTECKSSETADAGCAFSDKNNTSAGVNFNSIGGGVFAHLWNNDTIAIWQFARSEIPEDITSGNPDPTTWGIPMAYWSSETCDFGKYLYQHQLVLDTTICGNWAGAAYTQTYGGDCADALADASNFDNALWKINYIAVYGEN